MLSDVVSTYGVMFLIMLVLVGAMMAMGMINQWSMLHAEAAYIASTMAKFGGYTDVAASSLSSFCSETGMDESKITKQVSARGPVMRGTVMWVRLSYPFEFKICPSLPGFTVPISAKAYGVSNYLSGTPIAGSVYVNP